MKENIVIMENRAKQIRRGIFFMMKLSFHLRRKLTEKKHPSLGGKKIKFSENLHLNTIKALIVNGKISQ